MLWFKTLTFQYSVTGVIVGHAWRSGDRVMICLGIALMCFQGVELLLNSLRKKKLFDSRAEDICWQIAECGYAGNPGYLAKQYEKLARFVKNI